MVEGGKCPFDKLRERVFYVSTKPFGVFFLLAKQYRAMEGGLAARRFFLGWLRERFIYVLAKKCPFDKLRERVFFVLAKEVSLRRAQGTCFFFVLAKKYKAMDGGLAARRFSKKISDPIKNPRRDFLWAGDLRGIGGAAEAVP